MLSSLSTQTLSVMAFFFLDISTPRSDCVDGSVRLMGGSNSTIGRVEICINHAWGSVCNSKFGTNEALVICRQLGFSTDGECTSIMGY